MTDVVKHLMDLWDIHEAKRDKGMKLLSTIYSNILNNPSETKYHDLNFINISTKFIECKPCMHLLFVVGFSKSVDGTRLKWKYNEMNMKLLNDANDALQTKIKRDDDDDDKMYDEEEEAIINQLISLGNADNKKEVENAMKNVINNKDINEIAEYIINKQNNEQQIELQNELLMVNDENNKENTSVKCIENELKDNMDDDGIDDKSTVNTMVDVEHENEEENNNKNKDNTNDSKQNEKKDETNKSKKGDMDFLSLLFGAMGDRESTASTKFKLFTGETVYLDAYYENKWYSATINKWNVHYDMIEYKVLLQQRADIEIWIYQSTNTDCIECSKQYKYSKKDTIGKRKMYGGGVIIRKREPFIKFASLYSKAIKCTDSKIEERSVEQLLYYDCDTLNESYLIMIDDENIYRFNRDKQDWIILVAKPSYLVNCKGFIDNDNGKLYLLSSCVFAVFDLKTLKWNFIKSRISTTSTANICAFIGVYIKNKEENKENNDNNRFEENDAIQWFGKKEDKWKQGILTQINSDTHTAQITYSKFTYSKFTYSKVANHESCFISMDDVKNDDNINYHHDIKMQHVFRNTIFHYITINEHVKPRSFKIEQGILKCLKIDNDIDFKTECDISSLKFVYVPMVKRWYLFLQSEEKKKIGIWYREINDDAMFEVEWNRYCDIDLYVGDFDIVLVKRRIILIFVWGTGGVYGFDVWSRNLIKHDNVLWMKYNYDNAMFIEYDKWNEDIYIISQPSKTRLKIGVSDITPIGLFNDELVHGFIREFQQQYKLNIPTSLFAVIIAFMIVC